MREAARLARLAAKAAQRRSDDPEEARARKIAEKAARRRLTAKGLEVEEKKQVGRVEVLDLVLVWCLSMRYGEVYHLVCFILQFLAYDIGSWL